MVREIDELYPGLRALLEDPYGSLYLTEGMYELGIQFLTDRMRQHGGNIEILTLDTRNSLEAKYIIAAFERLLPYVDTREPGNFLNGLETVICKAGVGNDADPHILNADMIAALKSDCGGYAKKVSKGGFYQWQEENKAFINWLANTTTTVAYAALAYSSMKNWRSNSNRSGRLHENSISNKGGTSVPNSAKDIANQVKAKNGAPPQGYKGGKIYNNKPLKGGQKLPEGVIYKEYDVNPYIKGQGRGLERIVLGNDGSVWYTNDHYTTFIKIK